MPISIFDGYETRDVMVTGADVATPEDLCVALGIQRADGQDVPGLSWRHDGYRDGQKVTCMFLSWPLWLKGTLTKGKVIVGDTLYTAPCELHFPAMQNVEIVEPLRFTARLRTRQKG
jgi:hypothetical protein